MKRFLMCLAAAAFAFSAAAQEAQPVDSLSGEAADQQADNGVIGKYRRSSPVSYTHLGDARGVGVLPLPRFAGESLRLRRRAGHLIRFGGTATIDPTT